MNPADLCSDSLKGSARSVARAQSEAPENDRHKIGSGCSDTCFGAAAFCACALRLFGEMLRRYRRPLKGREMWVPLTGVEA